LGNWYQVTKKIGGRAYLYRQRSWREGGKVKTQCQCLGPITDTEVTFGNPFENNTTKVLRKHGIEPRVFEEPDWLKLWNEKKARYDADRAPGAADDIEVGKLPINWPKEERSSDQANTTIKRPRKMPTGVVFDGGLGDRNISPFPLAKEFERLCHALQAIGVDWSELPTIKIERGSKLGWRKAWFSRRTYVVTLPEDAGRTKFKQVYREALAQAFLEEIRRQDRGVYKTLMASAGTGYRRGEQVRQALGKIIHQGSSKAKVTFRKDLTKGGEKFRAGDVGMKLLGALDEQGIEW